ncbi:MAG: type II toxin-antitoxin system HicB family antitoxin [Bacteroidetes bacterium]|nr:type II toxin-antitoxin system HicB family antitoxin [Bacteroidota bacterium]
MEYLVVLMPEDDGRYSVIVPDLDGCFTHGDTKEEALAHAKEAIEGYIESLYQENMPIPLSVSREAHMVSITPDMPE